MFEMIFMNFDDTLLYQQHDYTQLVREELKMPNLPYAVHIAAPKTYNLDEDKNLPIFVSTKENNIDNKTINTAKHGNLVFSNIYTGDIFVKKTFSNIKEEPHNSSGIAPTPSNTPAGWTPPKSTYYRSEYRLLNRSEIPDITGTWIVVEHSGKFLSNTQTIEICRKNKNTQDEIKYLKSSFPSADELDINTSFSKNNLSPPINTHGFDITASSTVNKNEPLVLNVNFATRNNIDTSRGYLPVHLILSSNNLSLNKIVTIKIPEDMITSNNDTLEAYFSINLTSFFQNPKYKNIEPNETFYVTLISGSETSEVFTINNHD